MIDSSCSAVLIDAVVMLDPEVTERIAVDEHDAPVRAARQLFGAARKSGERDVDSHVVLLDKREERSQFVVRGTANRESLEASTGAGTAEVLSIGNRA